MNAKHKRPFHEEHELEQKKREFYLLERRLVKLDQELEELREEIVEFEKIYTVKMAERIAELETLEKELSRIKPEGASYWGRSEQSRQQRESRQDEEPEVSPEWVRSQSAGIRPGENLKDIYRKVAKSIHPDLSTNESERKKRQKLMAEANRAYAEADRLTLLSILEEWEQNSDTVTVGRETELMVITRRITRVNEQIRSIEAEIAHLRNTDIYRLIQRLQEAKWKGRDILAEMAAKLDSDILTACRKLNEISDVRQENEAAGLQGVRVVSFFPDKPIGSLFVRNRNSKNYLDWRKLGKAVGSVAVPAGKSLRLDVEKGRVSDLDGLSALDQDGLQACYLYGTTDAELAHVLRFKGMEELFLSGDGVTGEGIIHLLELAGLERLYLYDTAVNDVGLICLKYLRCLKYLTLCNAPITDSSLHRLQEALPSCNIVNLSCAGK